MKYLLLTLALLLSGCYSTGTPISDQSLNAFVKGETNTEQVEAALGKPQSVTSNSNGNKMWTYMFTDTDISPSTYIPFVGFFTGGAKSEFQTLIITFNEVGVITDWTNSVTTSEYNY